MQVPWMSLVLEPGKLTAQSTLQNPVGEPVRDFVFGFCATLPVKQFTSAGINHDTHFAVSSPEIWHSVGHTLAPKETVWAKVLKEPGMLSLAIQGKREDDLLGHINVKVEPSIRITPGIYVNVNDHFQAGEEEFKRDPAYLLGAIADNWSASKRRSRLLQRLKPQLPGAPSRYWARRIFLRLGSTIWTRHGPGVELF
jgi:hypothetical protein